MGVLHTWISEPCHVCEFISDEFKTKYEKDICFHESLFHSNAQGKMYDRFGRRFWYALSNELADNGYEDDIKVVTMGDSFSISPGVESYEIVVSPKTRTAKTDSYLHKWYRFE